MIDEDLNLIFAFHPIKQFLNPSLKVYLLMFSKYNKIISMFDNSMILHQSAVVQNQPISHISYRLEMSMLEDDRDIEIQREIRHKERRGIKGKKMN